mmetsp:Transcript_136912/g.237918  ORF Transcript_136912/g.237918 Transcript_136912/m.237918 type:complete len:207 (+) Transcript_136912:183-803(+)
MGIEGASALPVDLHHCAWCLSTVGASPLRAHGNVLSEGAKAQSTRAVMLNARIMNRSWWAGMEGGGLLHVVWRCSGNIDSPDAKDRQRLSGVFGTPVERAIHKGIIHGLACHCPPPNVIPAPAWSSLVSLTFVQGFGRFWAKLHGFPARPAPKGLNLGLKLNLCRLNQLSLPPAVSGKLKDLVLDLGKKLIPYRQDHLNLPPGLGF